MDTDESYIQDANDLEQLMNTQSLITFDPLCVRQKSNWSKRSKIYRFDELQFDPRILLKDIPEKSPKLQVLLKKIEDLDRQDMKKHGRLFKHFIFSDLKSSSYGAKLIASALIAKGMKLGYTAKLRKSIQPGVDKLSVQSSYDEDSEEDDEPLDLMSFDKLPKNIKKLDKSKESENEFYELEDEDSDEDEDSPEHLVSSRKLTLKKGGASPSPGSVGNQPEKKVKKEKRYEKIELLSNEVLEETQQNNLFLLSSVSVYHQAISVVLKKQLLKTFNSRPDNIYGELARIIVMDSGFKEGIDLFDIKYVHIFEPSVVAADQKQVIGRGTRTCGQKGLEFHPTQGWPLHVFVYDLQIPEQLQKSFLGTKSAIELYLKAMNLDIRLLTFASDLEKTTIVGSVDYDLNKNIHSFAIPIVSLDDDDELNEHLKSGEEVLYDGGGPKVAPILKRRLGAPILFPPQERLGYDAMKQHIQQYFSEFAWEDVKMENLCADKPGQAGGAGELIKFTPTQDFIRHYFTPNNQVKGMLLNHSVGTGKTCSAIAAATNNFEKQGYTILWVTRTTLKSDIWKNMFDQVCSESIRTEITRHNLVIPTEQNKRMKLLSKSWRIRPMSYKQFSNLVSKQNSYYEALVKINGKEDPLRKTLLIIDEAHKLYGGADLSSIERPDMNALKQALMYSYQYSGQDSVKLLLMTATPITNDPMELIKLINLCKGPDEQMPADFDAFSDTYLNEDGEFRPDGRVKYLDDIAGYVSYLNREKDARQFSQPIIQHIEVAIIKDMKNVGKFDKKIVRDIMDSDIPELKARIEEQSQEMKGELSDLDANRFKFLKKELCGGLEGKEQKKCEVIVKKNIRELIAEAKAEVKKIREKIKEVKDVVKEKSKLKRDTLADIRQNTEDYAEEYETYKETLLYQLKNKCAKRITNEKSLTDMISEHPTIVGYDKKIKEHDDRITVLEDEIKGMAMNHKKRMAHLKQIMKTDLNELERSVIKSTVRDDRKDYKALLKIKRKDLTASKKDTRKKTSEIQKTRKKYVVKIKKLLKKKMREEVKSKKNIEKEEKKLRKTLRKQEEVEEEINNDLLKDLVKKYRNQAMDQLLHYDEEMHREELEKEEKKQLKEIEKERKAVAKKQEAATKKAQKERLRQTKKAEKEQETAKKKAEKERETAKKKAEKEQEMARKKTEKEREISKKKAEKEKIKEEKKKMRETKKNRK
jgi:hypothetical protein